MIPELQRVKATITIEIEDAQQLQVLMSILDGAGVSLEVVVSQELLNETETTQTKSRILYDDFREKLQRAFFGGNRSVSARVYNNILRGHPGSFYGSTPIDKNEKGWYSQYGGHPFTKDFENVLTFDEWVDYILEFPPDKTPLMGIRNIGKKSIAEILDVLKRYRGA